MLQICVHFTWFNNTQPPFMPMHVSSMQDFGHITIMRWNSTSMGSNCVQPHEENKKRREVKEIGQGLVSFKCEIRSPSHTAKVDVKRSCCEPLQMQKGEGMKCLSSFRWACRLRSASLEANPGPCPAGLMCSASWTRIWWP